MQMAAESPENLIPVIKPTFFCQKCYQPLRLDPTFFAIDEKMLAELNASASSQDEKEFLSDNQTEPNVEKTATDLAHPERTVNITTKKCTAPYTGHSSLDSGNGFMLIDNLSNSSNSQQLSQHFRHSALLFDIISGHSNVDHPLCEECTDSLLDQMDQQLRITEDECKEYRDFLEQLESGSMEDPDMKALEEDLEKLHLQEQMLMEQLQMIENEREAIAAEGKKVEEEEKKIKEDEERYYREYVHYKRQLLEYEDEHRSVDNQLKYANSQLDKLRKTNVFNATFHIWHSGHFGTINNFRLGRLPSVPVEWHEINAAWGQAVLLLHALARKMNLDFQRYRLVPYGNHSYIESLTDRTKQLRLYGSGGFSFLWDTKFDSGMVAFLDCLQQFKEQVEKGDTGFCLPYRMERGRVEDSGTGSFYSIKIQFNSEEQWTKALKFMLTNLKWGLAWVSSQFASE